MKTGKETPHEHKCVSGLGNTEAFVKLCKQYSITPTKRQFSKFRNNKGRLFNAINKREA